MALSPPTTAQQTFSSTTPLSRWRASGLSKRTSGSSSPPARAVRAPRPRKSARSDRVGARGQRGTAASRAPLPSHRRLHPAGNSWHSPLPASGVPATIRILVPARTASATGGAVKLLPEDVRVSGVPRGLARHVGHDPPERMPVAVDRDRETRFRISGGTDRAVAVGDCRPIVGEHVARGTIGGDGHAVFLAGVPRGPGKVVAEPIPFRFGQVLDETKDRGATSDQDAAQLLIGQPAGLLQHAVPGE